MKLFDAECQRLLTTINEFLYLGKLDNQSLTLSPITAPVRHLVSRCLDAFRPQIAAGNISVSLTVDPACRFIRCDADLIQRVLHNILGNAVKYTPKGGAIRVEVSPDPAIRSFARITIIDSGAGIPPEAMSHITERYFKVLTHASGTGLSLSISKDIVMLHGGELTVVSPPPDQPQGTAISICLPLAEPPTLLIADDDVSIQKLLRQHLASQGYLILSAQSGKETILKAESNHPDLVLLDLVMEDVHGTTVILEMKSSRSIPYMPIIAVTGATLDEATAEVLNRFAIPTVAKPWKIEELLAKIETTLLGMSAFHTTHHKAPPLEIPYSKLASPE